MPHEIIRQIEAADVASADAASEMLRIWKSKISSDRTPSLDARRRNALNFLFERVCKSSMEDWKWFVNRAARNNYPNSKFAIKSIDWAINQLLGLMILCAPAAEQTTNERNIEGAAMKQVDCQPNDALW